MKIVFEYLSKIQELLEQIDAITQNQATILMGIRDDLGEEGEGIALIEEMVNCKDVIITELTQIEEKFQNAYEQYREELIRSGEIKELKSQVARVLHLKEEITRKEEQNMILLQNQSRKKVDRVKMQPNSNQVAAAYKKQQLKT